MNDNELLEGFDDDDRQWVSDLLDRADVEVRWLALQERRRARRKVAA